MEQTFRFGDPIDAPDLPRNYLPAGLPALRGQKDAGSRILLMTNVARDAIRYEIVQVEDLASPATWSGRGEPPGQQYGAIPKAPGNGDISAGIARPMNGNPPTDARGTVVLGPPLADQDFFGERRLSFKAAQRADIVNDGESVILVIDYGMAFWNTRFRSLAGPCRFREVQFLDFENGDPLAVIGSLDQAGIADLCDLADQEGQAAVVAELRQMFPFSFFGSGMDMDSLWHGTAMADLAGGADVGDPSGRVMFGMELPTAAVRDCGGDTLISVLPIALAAGLKMTEAYADRPLIIVLAFAFPSGPHDGSHPIARSITEMTAAARLAGRDVSLMLPAGNHLQDRCHARFGPTAAADPAPFVTWHLPPDDFSPNTIEICLSAPQTPTVRLTSPDGRTAETPIAPGTFFALEMDGSVIGGLHHVSDLSAGVAAENGILRLCLAGTAWQQPGQRPPPCGDWTVAIRAECDADLWVLRDDVNQDAASARPNQPSFFVDTLYRERNLTGAFGLDDTDTGGLRRSGTVSILTTAVDPDVFAVRADERIGTLPPQTAFYSGRPFAALPASAAAQWRDEIVDDGWEGRGAYAVGNGTERVFGVSGTSAAAAMAARRLADTT
jgi:hypothetical protein